MASITTNWQDTSGIKRQGCRIRPSPRFRYRLGQMNDLHPHMDFVL